LEEEQVQIVNRVTRWFDIFFPEYRKVYGRIDAKTGIIILKKAPLPADILCIGVDGIRQIWKDAKIRGYGPKKAKQLFAAAEHSVGMEGCISVRWNLWQLLEEYELVEKQLNDILQLIEGCLYQIPGADKLLKVPGAGLVTVAGFLSEVGDIKRFSDLKQIQKLAGLAVVECSWVFTGQRVFKECSVVKFSVIDFDLRSTHSVIVQAAAAHRNSWLSLRHRLGKWNR